MSRRSQWVTCSMMTRIHTVWVRRTGDAGEAEVTERLDGDRTGSANAQLACNDLQRYNAELACSRFRSYHEPLQRFLPLYGPIRGERRPRPV